jgi:hypothetical protein
MSDPYERAIVAVLGEARWQACAEDDDEAEITEEEAAAIYYVTEGLDGPDDISDEGEEARRWLIRAIRRMKDRRHRA